MVVEVMYVKNLYTAIGARDLFLGKNVSGWSFSTLVKLQT